MQGVNTREERELETEAWKRIDTDLDVGRNS